MANWYVKPGGDGSKDGTLGDDWDSETNFAAVTWGAGGVDGGDTLYVGGLNRQQLTVGHSGGAGTPITISGSHPGGAGTINGSSLVATWANHSGDIWSATLTTAPTVIYFDGVRGTLKANHDACTAARDWWWGSNVLYCYAASDPDILYTSPGIETAIRDYGIYNYYHYITIQNLELKNTIQRGLAFDGDGSNNYSIGCKAIGVVSHHNGAWAAESGYGQGIYTAGPNNLVQGCTAYSNGIHGISWLAGSGYICELNTAYDNEHNEIDMRGGVDGDDLTVRYNHCYATLAVKSTAGIYAAQNVVSPTNVKISYNIIHDTQVGIDVQNAVTGYANNNVVYNTSEYCYRIIPTTTFTLKNNIGYNTGYVNEGNQHTILQIDPCTNKTLTNNNWYCPTASRLIFSADTVTANYSLNDWADWKTDTGLDTNSIITDPVFMNLGGNDYRLQATSPCINKGANVSLTADYLGRTVPCGSAPEMGAYEFYTEINVNEACALRENISFWAGVPGVQIDILVHDGLMAISKVV